MQVLKLAQTRANILDDLIFLIYHIDLIAHGSFFYNPDNHPMFALEVSQSHSMTCTK